MSTWKKKQVLWAAAHEAQGRADAWGPTSHRREAVRPGVCQFRARAAAGSGAAGFLGRDGSSGNQHPPRLGHRSPFIREAATSSSRGKSAQARPPGSVLRRCARAHGAARSRDGRDGASGRSRLQEGDFRPGAPWKRGAPHPRPVRWVGRPPPRAPAGATETETGTARLNLRRSLVAIPPPPRHQVHF